ncbi:MAG: alpha/beta fold hydrolase [Actinomycetota bacterium]|nr:alpha/beta fold hydrolase [Actinomycetota bacterium]
MQTREIPAGEFTFTVREEGPPDGPLVLFLHGFPQSSHEWRHQLAAVGAAGYHAVAPDLRGYSPGARPTGVERYRANELVGDVVGIADALGADRFHLVGHDWGAALAWQVAGRQPARLASLTAVSVPHPVAMSAAMAGDEEQRAKSAYIKLFRLEGKAEDVLLADGGRRLVGMLRGYDFEPAEIEEYVGRLRDRATLTAALNYYRAFGRADVEAMGPVTTPTLYVWSTGDQALGRTAAEETGQHVSGPYRFEVLEGVSHWVPEQAAERVSELVLAHVRANDVPVG